MEERHHVKTIPGEAKAPEFVPNAEHVEPGTTTQSEDINIPMVATVVAFFAFFLAVVIISLQAWFYSSDAAERLRKQVPQYDLATPLGQLHYQELAELNGPASWNDHAGMGGEAKKVVRIPIDQAIKSTVQAYAQAPAAGAGNTQGR